LSAWLAELGSDDEEQQALAIEAIREIDAPALPHLLRSVSAFDSPWMKLRLWLARKNLIKANFAKERDEMRVAFQALTALGPEAAPALPEIVKMLPRQTFVAGMIIGAIGRVEGTHPAAKVLPVLMLRLGTGDVDERDAMTGALKATGPDAVLPLVKALSDPKEVVRQRAASLLGEIGLKPGNSVPALTKALKDGKASVRQSAAGALGGFREEAKMAVSDLLALLKDEEAQVRISAAVALKRIDPEQKAAMHVVLEHLNDERVRVEAASAIGSLRTDASEAVPALVEALMDSWKRLEGARFLQRLKRTGIDSESSERIKWAEGYFRVNIVYALEKSGVNSENVMEVLLRSLEDSEAWVRNAAANALGKFGSKAKEAVPGLLKSLEDQDHSVRENAVSALGRIGFDDPEIVGLLVKMLGHEDARMRGNAAEALGNCALNENAVKELALVLQDQRHEVRLRVANALGKVGSGAKAAVPALKQAAGDRFPSVRRAAENALKKIDSGETGEGVER
jgi:HEAT repeat protein